VKRLTNETERHENRYKSRWGRSVGKDGMIVEPGSRDEGSIQD